MGILRTPSDKCIFYMPKDLKICKWYAEISYQTCCNKVCCL